MSHLLKEQNALKFTSLSYLMYRGCHINIYLFRNLEQLLHHTNGCSSTFSKLPVWKTNTNNSAIYETQVDEKRSTICTHRYSHCLLKNTSTKHYKYAANQKLEHADDNSFRKHFSWIIFFFLQSKISRLKQRTHDGDHINFKLSRPDYPLAGKLLEWVEHGLRQCISSDIATTERNIYHCVKK